MAWVAALTFFLVFTGVPIAFALGLGGTFGVWLTGIPIPVIITRFFGGVDSFVFLAMPFYILAAEIMNRSGITERLIRLTSLATGDSAAARPIPTWELRFSSPESPARPSPTPARSGGSS